MLKAMALVAVVMSLIISSPEVEARKFGGGRSFGKLFKTAPIQKKQAPSNHGARQANPAGAKRGLMGGLMGGLLAGGLLAAFFGGAFEGIQLMDIIIFGLIAYFVMRLFRNMNRAKADSQKHQQAFAGDFPTFGQQTPKQFQEVQPGSSVMLGDEGDADVPHNLPKGFDHDAFIKGSLGHYRDIQGAWNTGNLELIREYVSADIFSELSDERAKLQGDQHTEVLFLDAEIVRADSNQQIAQLSLKFSGRYADRVEDIEEDITDIWHLERDLLKENAPWLIVGIE